MLLILVLLIAAWPLIAKAITTDEPSYYPQVDGTALDAPRAIVTESSSKDGDFSLTRTAAPRQVAASVYPSRGSKLAPKAGLDATLAKIAQCESQGDLYAKNPTSSARGKYQFLKGSWEGYGRQLWGSTDGHDIFSEADQDELARYVAETVGLSPWNASRGCWSR